MSMMVTVELQALVKILDNFKQCLITKQENCAHFPLFPTPQKIFNSFDILQGSYMLGKMIEFQNSQVGGLLKLFKCKLSTNSTNLATTPNILCEICPIISLFKRKSVTL